MKANKRGGPSAKRHTGRAESQASKESVRGRTELQDKARLANEPRPGLGTRANEPFPGDPQSKRQHRAKVRDNVSREQRSSREPNDMPLPREPQEQQPDSWAQEAERETGVSGHLAAD